jgi:S-adenosylhomocysteine hydrolase
MGMSYFDEQSFDKEYLEMVQASVIFVCYDASEIMKKQFCVVCLKESEDFLVKNAQVTAWGILAIILQSCEECLTELMIDVVGYGRCGKAIVQLLDALGVQCRVIVKEVKNYTR